MKLNQANILIVDDDKDVLTAVRLLLKNSVRQIATESRPDNLMRLLSQQSFDVLMLDMNFRGAINTGNEGIYWLREVKSKYPQIPVVMITAYADIDLAVKSLKEGAADFVVKPWQNDALLHTLSEVLQEKKDPKSKHKNISGDDDVIIGESESMQALFLQLEKAAPSDANILLLGENGTGKDLIAKAIHKKSARKNNPFIKVDVGALTETLFESELFGHKKGAFTDAKDDRVGLIKAANGGTLFLDEIGNISLHQQAKLLTVLQNREIMRLGSNIPIPVDIRLISATNLPLSELANEQKFRKDLIYRINTVELNIPPLRKRDGDVLLLAEHFLQFYEKKYMKPTMRFSEKAKEKLVGYHYLGNVRELQYAIERAVIMSDESILKPEDIIFSLIEGVSDKKTMTDSYNLEEIEKQTILHALEKHNGNISKAAHELGLTRAALYRRMSKYDI
ncbi:MAG: sigma-54 dependent transcriptional regulator [Bacteroidales bacterium]|jgi:DNA-binding NtrC family response regulator|nr:sigma-54 dependent transcriptional regulator [Bacteroidales bacterium]